MFDLRLSGRIMGRTTQEDLLEDGNPKKYKHCCGR
jgi:hypothetical protein